MQNVSDQTSLYYMGNIYRLAGRLELERLELPALALLVQLEPRGLVLEHSRLPPAKAGPKESS
jgi:hypothetical protein